MTSTAREDADVARRRRRVTAAIKESLRELSIQLSLLNHQVGTHIDLRDVDFSCLDLINRFEPLSPSALARRAGLHPATMTGILDRLQLGGWVTRDRDPDGPDRRAVAVRNRPTRWRLNAGGPRSGVKERALENSASLDRLRRREVGGPHRDRAAAAARRLGLIP